MRMVLIPALFLVLGLTSGPLYAAPQQVPSTDTGQSPFRFRDAYLLESRIASRKAAYDPNHSEELISRMDPGLANPDARLYRQRRDDPTTYQGAAWVDYVNDTDLYRQMGSLDLAEKQYTEVLNMLRKAQGPSSSDVALMLDHLGEFYLEERRFDQAYQTFSEAVEVRRSSLNTFTCPVVPQQVSLLSNRSLRACRLHLSDLLTRLGQLDIGKGDLASANKKLSEAVAIVNESDNLRDNNGLYAIYFRSLALEHQSNWREAEDLWLEAVKLREVMRDSANYWDAQKEIAAFYARHGDFRSAAAIAARVQVETAGKQQWLLPGHTQLLDNRRRYEISRQYGIESDTAMNEILAVDAWQTKGPEAAASLLKDPTYESFIFKRGSDSERTQLLGWFAKRIYLHMSILLDGNPSQDRIDEAYTLLSKVKGRYLASISDVTRSVEMERSNPDTHIPEFSMLDQLAGVRTNRARLFLQTALDGEKLDPIQLAANENTQRILSDALVSGTEAASTGSVFSAKTLSQSVPENTAFIDILAWERKDRDSSKPPHREYGAFVVRHNQPIRYFRLGTVESIDDDIDRASFGETVGLERSFQVPGQRPPVTPTQLQSLLKGLYNKVIAPLEPSLQGATKLYIAPDGKLALAPISAFLDARGSYILESRTITYVGSWGDVMSTQAVYSSKSSPPLIVGDPAFKMNLQDPTSAPTAASRLKLRPKGLPDLPSAAIEANEVQKILGVSSDRVLIGKDARKDAIRSAHSPEILHIATHSVANFPWIPPVAKFSIFEFPQPWDTQYPLLQSMIAFAGADHRQEDSEDGMLTALEVSSLHLIGSKLVVLSSCESGAGTLLDAQGVLGLRAAFSMAGAEALVTTLWPVNDEAELRFMTFFYSHRAEGPAEAVRLAQRDMLKMDQFSSPKYWAGYVVSGSPVREHAKPYR
jgi:CHAT domain-containing protein/tetratricopeptide (TPR) repeat protein